MGQNCIGVIRDVRVWRDDYGQWAADTRLDLVYPERTRIDYYAHTGIDKSSESLLPEYFDPLVQIGLPRKIVRQYVSATRRLERAYDEEHSPRAARRLEELKGILAGLNQHATEILKDKAVRAEVSPWPLKSDQSYQVRLLPYSFGN